MNDVKPARLTQAQRTELSDHKMAEAAISLIVENGPAGTSLKEVGLRAGFSRGLASHRFGVKDNLFAFVLRQVGDNWLAHLKRATEGQSGLEAINRAVDEHYQFCVEAPDQVRAFYTLWFESVNAGSELKQLIGGIHRRRQQDVASWILTDDAISPGTKARAEAIAAQFSASIIGIVYYWLANPDDLEVTRTLHADLKHTMQLLVS